MTEYLGMRQTYGGLALFFRHVRGELVGIAGTYVDDTLRTETKDFQLLNNKTGMRFESRVATSARLTFSGIEITRDADRVLLQQRKQAERMRFLQPSVSYSEFKSALTKMAWLNHTRPDICCAVAQLAQASECTFRSEHFRLLKVATRVIKGDTGKVILHRQLDKQTLRIMAYADGSFESNQEEARS